MNNIKKTLPATLAALVITIFLAGGMFAVGGEALTGTASAASAPTQIVIDQAAAQADPAQAALIAEYQAREAQYQAQINEAVSRITTANQQVEIANQQLQEYQNLLAQLQESGLITIASDGTITINQQQTAFGGESHPGGHH